MYLKNKITLYIKSNIFLKNIIVLIGGTAIGQIIAVVTVPIITRIYTPEDYGLVTAFIGILSVLGGVANLRYSAAIPIERDKESAKNLLRLSFSITLVLGVLLSVFVLFYNDLILNYVGSKIDSIYVWVLPICFIAIGFNDALTNWALRNKFFGAITRGKVIQNSFASLTKIGAGVLGNNGGLLFGQVVQHVSYFFVLVLKLCKNERDLIINFNAKKIWEQAEKYKNFPKFQGPSQLLLTVVPQLPIFYLGYYFSTIEVGYYGLAISMVNLPLNLISTSVSQVYFSEISEYGINRPSKVLKLSKVVVRKMASISAIVFLFLFFLGPLLFSVFFGEEWRIAGEIAKWLAIPICINFISSPIMQCINLFQLQKIQLIFNLCRITFITSAFYFCYALKLDLMQTIKIYSSVLSLISLSMFVLIFEIIKKKIILNRSY